MEKYPAKDGIPASVLCRDKRHAYEMILKHARRLTKDEVVLFLKTALRLPAEDGKAYMEVAIASMAITCAELSGVAASTHSYMLLLNHEPGTPERASHFLREFGAP